MQYTIVPAVGVGCNLEKVLLVGNPAEILIDRSLAQVEYALFFGTNSPLEQTPSFYKRNSLGGIIYKLMQEETITKPEDVLYLNTFRVPKQDRLKGVGTQAIQALKDIAIKEGFLYVLAEVYKPELSLFLQKNGFSCVGFDTFGVRLKNNQL